MRPDYATAAAAIHPAATLEAALGLVMHHAGRPESVSESVRLLAACSKFAPDPKSRAAVDIVQIVGDALGPRGAPIPGAESIVAALYGAGEGRNVLATTDNTVERIETDAEPETQTTAEILRGWAADAEEAMQGPLLALAQHAEQELATAGQSVAADAAREAERSALEAIAERLSAIETGTHPEAPIAIEPETFAVLACLTRLEASVKYGLQAMREALDLKDKVGAEAHAWRAKAEASEKALFDARRAAESLRLALHGGLEAAS